MKSLKLTRENVVDLLVTALEGGSNYWYMITYQPDVLREGLDTEAKIEYLLDHPEVYVNIEDLESHDFLGKLCKKTIDEAKQQFKREYPDSYLDVLNEAWDADTADIFFQLVIMKDVVYG